MRFNYIKLYFFSLFILLSFISSAQIDVLKNISNTANSFIDNEKIQSDKDISDGLTEALRISVTKSCDNASQVNGFYKNDDIKIPFPSKINKVKKACLKIGLNKLVLDFEYSMNQTAELVSSTATEIIVQAVSSLRFNDAIKILNGSENEATLYLKDKSFDNLYDTFYPTVKNKMDSTGVQKILDLILTRYNKIPLVKKVKFDLTDYITLQTIGGIFYLIAENEKEIRNNPKARTTQILKKIFN